MLRLFDVWRYSWLCAGEAERDVAQLRDMTCAKAAFTPLKIKPQMQWLEQLHSSIQVLSPWFYTLKLSMILKYFGTVCISSACRQNLYYLQSLQERICFSVLCKRKKRFRRVGFDVRKLILSSLHTLVMVQVNNQWGLSPFPNQYENNVRVFWKHQSSLRHSSVIPWFRHGSCLHTRHLLNLLVTRPCK